MNNLFNTLILREEQEESQVDTYQRLWILFQGRIASRAMNEKDLSIEKDFLHELLVEMATLEADVILGEERC